MPIFYTDSGSFGDLTVSGSTIMSASSGIPLQIIGSGSTLFSILGSSGELFRISDSGSSTELFSVSSGSATILSIDNTKRVNITGSLFVIGNTTLTGSLFKFTGDTEITGSFKVITGSNSQPAMQINSEGVFIIGQYNTTPIAVAGGLIFSGSEYFLGF